MVRSSQKGFTLIEIIVVLAIMGVLMSIVMYNLSIAKTKSRDHKRISDVKQIQLALTQFFGACDIYPGATGAPYAIVGTESCVAPDGSTVVFSQFLSNIPRDPSTNAVYPYAIGPQSTTFCLGTEFELADSGNNLTDDANCEGTFGLTGQITSGGAVPYTLKGSFSF